VTCALAVAAVRVLLLQFVTANPLKVRTHQNQPFVVADLPGHRSMKLLSNPEGVAQHKHVTNPLVLQEPPASGVSVGDVWQLLAGRKPLQNQWVLTNIQVHTLCVQHVMCENARNQLCFLSIPRSTNSCM